MDLKIALRALRNSPTFTLLAIAILALGIGANTAIFSVVHGVILRPLAYRNADRLVSLGVTFKHQGGYGQLSGPDFLDYHRQSNAFESMTAYGALEDTSSVVVGSTAEFAGVCTVSDGFLKTMGLEPIQGRAFTRDDWKPKLPKVALVSEGFWVRHFGNRPFQSGRSLKTSDVRLEIIGILPAGFHFPDSESTEVWVPLPVDSKERSAHNYRVVARLKPRVSVEQAQVQLTAIADRLAKAYPASNKLIGIRVTPLRDYNVRQVKTSLYILLAAVLLVLLIACANVANLLLARGTGRVREIAIRAALGAGKARILRQLFVENMLLALAGCVAGVLLAKAGLPALLALSPSYVPRLDQVRIDTPVLAFCACAALLASVLFGLAPALGASRVDPNESLRVGGSRGVLGGATGTLRGLFVTAQVALSVILVVSAGLLLKSFAAMTRVDLGFRPEKLLLAELGVPEAGGADRQHLYDSFLRPLLARLSASPGVGSAGLTSVPPGNPEWHSDGDYIITGQSMKDFNITAPQAGFSVVSPDYFRTLSIPVLGGRVFSGHDDASAPPVAIISESLARRSFGHQNPLGRAILCGWDENSMKWMTIVGVVGDVRIDSPNHPASAEIYMPYLQHRVGGVNILVKDGANPLQLAGVFRRYVRQLNPEVSVKFSTMENRLSAALATPRFSSILISIFAALAIALAVIGIYGVMAYSVSQRTSEIGLRFALGAERGGILRMVLAQALKLVGIGLMVGSAGAVAATRILKSQLFGTSPADPSTYALALVLLAAVGTLASFVPAWQASRTEPIDALRKE